MNKKGLLDDTIVVIYGDHSGVHKYYNSKLESVNFEEDWWKNKDKKIPFIVYNKELEGKTIDTFGGHIDIMPTVLYLLGVKDDLYRNTVMGRILVNTNRNYTITKGNEIKGNIDNEEDKDHIEHAYDISRKIILDHYYEENGLID